MLPVNLNQFKLLGQGQENKYVLIQNFRHTYIHAAHAARTHSYEFSAW